jgi:Domain of unknown function (DUF4279)
MPMSAPGADDLARFQRPVGRDALESFPDRAWENSAVSIVSTTSASLRIFGSDLDPDEMTRLLGKEPHRVQRRGQPMKLPDGSEGRIIDFSSWTINAERTSPGDLDNQIAAILDGMTDDRSVWAAISGAYRMDIFCGLFMRDDPEEISISPKTLLSLGERGIKLSLDIYGPTD